MVLSKARFQTLLQYSRKKHRADAGAFFVEGWRWLDEALRAGTPLECVLATADAARSAAESGLLARARAVAREFYETDATQLARLTGSVSAPGVAALVAWQPQEIAPVIAALPATGRALVVALDGVSDPGNAGTLVRSADWFGAAAVIFSGGGVEPTNPKVVRSTMGSLFRVPIAFAPTLPAAVEHLYAAGFIPVGAALDGDALDAFVWPDRAVLVVGNEAAGIQPAVAAVLPHRVHIPTQGRAESLNAGVAGSILMHEWRRFGGR